MKQLIQIQSTLLLPALSFLSSLVAS